MTGHILHFKVTNTGWSKPAYIAVCNKEEAGSLIYTLCVAYAVPSFDRATTTIENISVEDIPIGSRVTTNIPNYQDAKAATSLLNSVKD